MSRKAIKESKFPKFSLSIEQITKNASAIEIKPKKKTNDYGGQSVDLKLNDGKSMNRRVSMELCNQYSRFGVSKFQDKKDPSKFTTSIQIPLNENPELKEMAEATDEHMIEQLYEHRVALWNDESIDKRFIKKIYKGMQRKPKKEESLQEYGMNYKIIIGQNCKYFRTLPEEPDHFIPCDQSELIDKEGNYTIIVSLPRVFIKDTECGIVSYANNILFHGDVESSDEIFSNVKRKRVDPKPAENQELSQDTSPTPFKTPLKKDEALSPPAKKQKLEELSNQDGYD